MDIRSIWSILIKIIIFIAAIFLALTIYETINGIYVGSKKGAARDAAYNYAKVIEYEIVVQQMNGIEPKKTDLFIYTNLPNQGTKPTRVEIILDNGKVDRGEMVFGEYVVTFKNGSIFSIKKEK